MLILLTLSLLFFTALALLLLRWLKPDFRAAWLVGVGGSFLAWISVFLWQLDMPQDFTLPAWQPATLFPDSPVFLADKISWAYALSLATLALAAMLTSVVRKNFPYSPAWAGILAITGMGMLAVLAENTLTLALAWAAIDITELITLIRAVKGEKARERVVISFATRVAGLGFLLWANLFGVSSGFSSNLGDIPTQVGVYMLIASGLRLGVIPVHLPFTAEPTLRRGYGTVLRLVSAASSLVLLARIPANSIAPSGWTPILFGLVALAALYGGWMWFRTSQTLAARPYWIIGMASLSVASALRANLVGSIAWGNALILGGGALFLFSAQQKWLTRLLLVSLFSLSALPFSLTASGWMSNTNIGWGYWLFFIPAQTLLLAGYVQHARHPVGSELESHPKWTRSIYFSGISLLVVVMLLLGLWGWDGARTLGIWWVSGTVLLLGITLLWLQTRLHLLQTPQMRWVKPVTKSGINHIYNNLWSLYRLFTNIANFITKTLESDGGVIWTLLFIVLFASLLAGGLG